MARKAGISLPVQAGIMPVSYTHLDVYKRQSPGGITPENSAVVAHIFEVIARLAEDLELGNGYRVVTNCGRDGGQSVPHLHFHVLAKRSLAWPPG